MTRLHDEILIRGRTRGVGTLRERLIGGWPYLAVSAWTAQEEARAAAAAIRCEGRRARVTRDLCPERAGCRDRWMWVAWASLDDPAVEMEERPAPSPRRPEGAAPDPQRQLPDALLLRSDGAGPRTYHYEGRVYMAVSAWSDKEEARAAAASIRAEGGCARVVPAIRPVISMPPTDRLDPRHEAWLGRPWRRHGKTNNRYMWLVFALTPSSTEIAAHAGEIEGARS